VPEFAKLKQATKQIHAAVVQLFYGGKAEDFTAFGGMRVSDALTQVEGTAVDAWFAAPESDGDPLVVVEVTDLLLQFTSLESATFGVAHEYGHAFSQGLLEKMSMANAGGDRSEVVADLGAAWAMYHAYKCDWQTVETALEQAVTEGIFAADRMDNHPPGAARVGYVKELIKLVKAGTSFEDAAKKILSGVSG
jgi:hypothetical protein